MTATELHMQISTLDDMLADIYSRWHAASALAIERCVTMDAHDPAFQPCKALAAEYDRIKAWATEARRQLHVARHVEDLARCDAA